MAESPTRELLLDEREVRVLGCLVEKELSTPDYYPMTLNALKSACNQKTNREPVVEYGETDVVEALDGLQRKRLVGNASSSFSRAAKYRHALAEVLGLDRPRLAVLASTLLRGPETTGEIRTRTSRMHEFASLEEVDVVLEQLAEWDPPLVKQMPRRPGQKEARYAHLLGGEPEVESGPIARSTSGLEGRLEELEDEVAALRESLAELSEAFRRFRAQFE